MSTHNQATIETNSEWFKENDNYIASQSQLKVYRDIQKIVEREMQDAGEVLDIGNGGFFNYDTALTKHVTAVDLFLQDGAGPTSNSTFKSGSFLDLPFASESFDCALQQNVLHHVTGASAEENHANMRRCLAEMYRCLRGGGKAVLIESTVGPKFHAFECLVYGTALKLKRGGHPVTFQFTKEHLIEAAEECGFEVEKCAYVPRGWFVLQLGYRWPSLLTPARPIQLILRKPETPVRRAAAA